VDLKRWYRWYFSLDVCHSEKNSLVALIVKYDVAVCGLYMPNCSIHVLNALKITRSELNTNQWQNKYKISHCSHKTNMDHTTVKTNTAICHPNFITVKSDRQTWLYWNLCITQSLEIVSGGGAGMGSTRDLKSTHFYDKQWISSNFRLSSNQNE
jgi:hypothetical protein